MKAGRVRQFRRRVLGWIRGMLPLPRPTRLARFLPEVYLRGEGLEIGALHDPMRVPTDTRVRYVDRLSVADLRVQYPELKKTALVPVDIVTDGERLSGIGDESQDFVIARHFLEHCQDPIGTLKQFFRVLKPGGIAYLAIPDKRFTFDRERPITSLQHLLEDHERGPEPTRRAHFEEYVRFVHGADTDAEVQRQADELMARDYSIHYHVWTQHELLELMLALREQLTFDVEAFCQNRHEAIFVLRKATAESAQVHQRRPVGFQDLTRRAG